MEISRTQTSGDLTIRPINTNLEDQEYWDNSFSLTAAEMEATSTVPVLVKQAYKTINTYIANGVAATSAGGFGHNQTVSDSTYTQIGYKARGDNDDAFSYWKTDFMK
jgi:hypothetical protein